MSRVIVVYHSGYGHIRRMAEAAAAGAALLAIDSAGHLPDGGWAALDAADAIIMGSPTCMGCVSRQFKKFADDASSKQWFAQQWQDKLFAGFTNSATM